MTAKYLHLRYLLILTLLFSLLFAVLAIHPHDRSDWALENLLVLAFAVALGLSYRAFPLSRLSYTLIFLFLCLHEVGAHYTYSKVPYDAWMTSAFGVSLNEMLGWQRNNFDRVVHFLFGALLVYPIRELYCRVANARGFWGYFFPLELAMAASMLYELFEWAAASLFGGDLGVAYLGTQGDIWDAHKDMALASLGALITLLLVLLTNLWLNPNFGREWRDSLRVKRHRPMGEDELEHLLQDTDQVTDKSSQK
ncbi:putative membrane protein [Halopseudomonas sabulinigri]|uniref:Putative membrane protein n=1 Tax=Halopseudomonas sabulinigri TaxID=472181 RepID=A0A1H1NQ83_9GAMM|nr:DUF2238 domain-containing protein [Halopseudomonas sabulinigri]SDS01073.1 putative membrane protein [Halopseudomonas sabulinigri]